MDRQTALELIIAAARAHAEETASFDAHTDEERAELEQLWTAIETLGRS